MVRIEVNYRLSEYVQLTSQFRPSSPGNRAVVRREAGSLLSKNKTVERLAIYVIAPLMFVYKKSKVGRCVFEADEVGLSRTSKTGTFSFPWTEIWAVHSLPGTFVVELDQGAMPLPFRCFTQQEHQMFTQLIPVGKLVASAQHLHPDEA